MKPDVITVLIGTGPTFLGVLFMIWQMSRIQDQLNKRIDDTNSRIETLRADFNKRIEDLRTDFNKRIDDLRDTLRAELRAAIAEVRFR